MLVVAQPSEKPRLGQTVHLCQLHLRQSLPHAVNELWGDGRSAIAQLRETAQIIVSQLRKLGEDIDHRRDEHGARNPLPLDRFTKELRAEARNGDLAGATAGCAEHERKIGDVKERRGVQEYTPFRRR